MTSSEQSSNPERERYTCVLWVDRPVASMGRRELAHMLTGMLMGVKYVSAVYVESDES